MNIETRLNKLENSFCSECGRPLKPLQEQSEGDEEPSIDISTMSVQQKRDLLAKLYLDKYPRARLAPPLNLTEFQMLDPVTQLGVIRETPEAAW